MLYLKEMLNINDWFRVQATYAHNRMLACGNNPRMAYLWAQTRDYWNAQAEDIMVEVHAIIASFAPPNEIEILP